MTHDPRRDPRALLASMPEELDFGEIIDLDDLAVDYRDQVSAAVRDAVKFNERMGGFMGLEVHVPEKERWDKRKFLAVMISFLNSWTQRVVVSCPHMDLPPELSRPGVVNLSGRSAQCIPCIESGLMVALAEEDDQVCDLCNRPINDGMYWAVSTVMGSMVFAASTCDSCHDFILDGTE